MIYRLSCFDVDRNYVIGSDSIKTSVIKLPLSAERVPGTLRRVIKTFEPSKNSAFVNKHM